MCNCPLKWKALSTCWNLSTWSYSILYIYYIEWNENKGKIRELEKKTFQLFLSSDTKNTIKQHTQILPSSHIPNHSITERCAQIGNSNLQSGLTYSSQVLHGTTVQDEQFSPDWFTFSHIYMYIHKLLLFFLKECFPWFTRLHLCLSLQRTRSAVVVKAAAIISVTVTSVE